MGESYKPGSVRWLRNSPFTNVTPLGRRDCVVGRSNWRSESHAEWRRQFIWLSCTEYRAAGATCACLSAPATLLPHSPADKTRATVALAAMLQGWSKAGSRTSGDFFYGQPAAFVIYPDVRRRGLPAGASDEETKGPRPRGSGPMKGTFPAPDRPFLPYSSPSETSRLSSIRPVALKPWSSW